MARFLNSTDSVYIFLCNQIEEYVKFVNQIINDKDFLICIGKLLPFDKVAKVSMAVLPEKQMIGEMGIVIMRMDFEPSLFSLAVSLTIDREKDILQEYTIFLTACKTIIELQDYVKDREFRKQVMEHCSKKVFLNKEIQHISL